MKRLLILLFAVCACFWACNKAPATSGAGSVDSYFKIYNIQLTSFTQYPFLYSDNAGNAYIVGTDTNVYIAKLDKSGNYMWKKEYPSATLSNAIVRCFFDGSYMYMIRTDNNFATDYNYFVDKFDLDGNMVSDNMFAANTNIRPYPNNLSGFKPLYTMAQNGNIAFLTTTYLSNDTVPSLTIYSNTGAFISNIVLDTLDIYHFPGYCLATKEGGYLVVEQQRIIKNGNYDYEFYFYFVDALGNVIWKKTYNSGNFGGSGLYFSNGYYTDYIMEDNYENFVMYFYRNSASSVNLGTLQKATLNLNGDIISYGNTKAVHVVSMLQKSDGNILALEQLDDSLFYGIMPTASYIYDMKSDFSAVKVKTFALAGKGVMLCSMAPTVNNGYLFFGQIQSNSDTLLQNVFIKTNSNEDY